MSASRTPTLRPRSRSPSARLTEVVDLPTPPLPDATAMIASTPGTPGGPCRRAATAPRRGAAAGAIAARAPQPAARRSAVRAIIAEVHAGHRPHRLLGPLAHRLPGLHHRRVDTDREEHLTVADHDIGQRAGIGQRLPSGGHGGKLCRTWSLVGAMFLLLAPDAGLALDPRLDRPTERRSIAELQPHRPADFTEARQDQQRPRHPILLWSHAL